MALIRISESENWIVDYNTERDMYRVSYFEDGHFVDQHRFGCSPMEKHIYDYASAYVKGAADFIQYVEDCYGMFVPVDANEMKDMLKDFLGRIGIVKEV